MHNLAHNSRFVIFNRMVRLVVKNEFYDMLALRPFKFQREPLKVRVSS
jgi:hypothetical protein